MNTLFSNINNILLHPTNENTININDINSNINNENYSFMNDSYLFVLEYTKNYNNEIKEFYTSILESDGNRELINEASNSLIDYLKKIIDKFIEFIKSLFNKFKSKMASIFTSEKKILNNENLLKNYNGPGFELNGNNYSNINDNSNAIFTSNVKFIIDRINKAGSGSNSYSINSYSDDVRRDLQDIHDNIVNLTETIYDEFRGNLVNKNPISTSSFADALFRFYRNGEDSTSTLTIDSRTIYKSFDDFKNYKTKITYANSALDGIVEIFKIEKEIMNSDIIKSKNGNGDYIKFDPSRLSVSDKNIVEDRINLIIKAKMSIIQECCSICSLAFAAKLTAIKDEFVQNKKILSIALSKIKEEEK